MNLDKERLEAQFKKLPNGTRLPEELDKKILSALKNPLNDKETNKPNRSRKRSSKLVPILAMVACLLILIPLGFYHMGKTSSVKETTESTHFKTIQAFLKLEFTGPNKVFQEALEQVDATGNSTRLDAYNKKHYQPLLAKDYYQNFINSRYELFWLEPAYKEGYQLRPTNIVIKKGDGSYDWKAKVEYTKNGITKTATINGLINLNENGRIIYVRFIEGDNGLWKLWNTINRP